MQLLIETSFSLCGNERGWKSSDKISEINSIKYPQKNHDIIFFQ